MRGRWALRDYPGLLWLVLAAAVALIHPFLPGARWLMVHLVLLGALTHSAMVWSTHFAQALLKTRPGLDDRRTQAHRLRLLLVGTAATLVGVPTGWWWLVALGAGAVSVAVLWHGVQLLRRLRAALPGRFRVTVRYYVAAACCLPVGAALGATLALGLDDAAHARLLLGHVSVNLLGWVGLTVTGTLLTLWPTMLRTRIAPGAESRARQALPILSGAVAALAVAALADLRWLSVAALLGYAGALLWWASAVLAPARSAPPREFGAASVAAALLWWLVGLGAVLVRLLRSDEWADAVTGLGTVTAVLVVGFGAQLLIGALSYLVPSVLGGGPAAVRAGAGWFDRWGTARLVIVNAGLTLCLLPVPSLVRIGVAVLVLLALAAFVPLMLGGTLVMARARREVEGAGAGHPPRPAAPGPRRMPSVWSGRQGLAATAALVLVSSVGVLADPAAAGLRPLLPSATVATPQVAPTGQTTTVRVSAADMRFEPASVRVPAGDRLVVELSNADDEDVHDLTLLGRTTPRLAPGESATLDVGVVSTSTQGWCTIVGHRQQGMTFDVLVAGATAADTATEDTAYPRTPQLDPDATVRSPVDPAVDPSGTTRTHRLTLTAEEAELEVAPGVTQTRWTFNGRVPGPTLRGRVGDVFEVTLVNDGSMGHSIDFHAGALAPDAPMRTIPPGESLVYRFTAERSGIWMYHCSTSPMSAHIAAGMHGAVIIEPADGLPPVDEEYLVVQSEVYLSPGSGQDTSPAEVDGDAVSAERPTFVTFNGIAGQYGEGRRPFTATTGDRVRFWVLDAGPNRPSSFHVVGGQFDTVYAEGSYLLGPRAESAGSQVLGLHPAQGGFVELVLPEAGTYPVVSHLMVDAERGARGVLEVSDARSR